MKVLLMLLLALSGAMSAQTVKDMFLSLPPNANPPITYCTTTGLSVVLTTTWNGVALADQALTVQDTLTLTPVSGHNWKCLGPYSAKVNWTDSTNGACQAIAKASYNIQASCNGNSCTPESRSSDYNITWNNAACSN